MTERNGSDTALEPLTISIALATYNGAQHIREQLKSLADQTVLPFELVVTDDLSADHTVELIEEFALTAPFPVRIFRNPQKLGFADNFFKAASLCTGTLIAFCDQDDRWLKDKLRICSEPFRDPDVWICVHSSRLWYGGEQFGACIPNLKQRKIMPAGVVDPLDNHLGFSNVIRADVLRVIDNTTRPRHPRIVKSVSPLPHPMVHDQWIWFIGSIFGKVAYIPEVQCFYRQHSGNTVGFTFTDQSVRKRLSIDKAALFAQGAEVAYECAEFIEKMSEPLPKAKRASALHAAESMRSRGKLFHLRRNLYLAQSGLSDRIRAFFALCREHGYHSNCHRFAFGLNALLKDLFVGVPGAARLFRK